MPDFTDLIKNTSYKTMTKPFFVNEAFSTSPVERNCSIHGDADSTVGNFASYTLGANPVKSAKSWETTTAFIANSFGALIIMCLQATGGSPMSALEIWASDTVDTADGTKIYDLDTDIDTGVYMTVVLKIPAGKYITIKATASGVSIIPTYSAIINLSK